MASRGVENIETDWEAPTSHEQWAQKFTEAVTRRLVRIRVPSSVCGQPSNHLVSENRADLAPSCPVGRALLAYRNVGDSSGKERTHEHAGAACDPVGGPSRC